MPEFAPKILKDLPEQTIPKPGEVTKLEVKVTGKPKPKVKWFKEKELIQPSEEYQIEEFDDGTSVLVINNVYPDDQGEITFEAHNPLGVAVTTTELSVEGIFFIGIWIRNLTNEIIFFFARNFLSKKNKFSLQEFEFKKNSFPFPSLFCVCVNLISLCYTFIHKVHYDP